MAFFIFINIENIFVNFIKISKKLLQLHKNICIMVTQWLKVVPSGEFLIKNLTKGGPQGALWNI